MADAVPHAFFSYARSDAAFVLKVAQQLRRLGRKVWVDQLDIPKGARWDEAVEGALRASPCLMVVLSPASVKSQNVLDEVAFALDEKRPVLPILLQPVVLPFRLKRLQYIDFTGDYDAAFEQMVAALDAVVPSASALAASTGDAPAPPAAAPAAAAPLSVLAPTPAPEPAPEPTPAAAPPPPAPSSSMPPPAQPVTSAAPPGGLAAGTASAVPTLRRWPLAWLGGGAAALVALAYVLLTRDPVAPGATPAVPVPVPAPTTLTQPPAAPRSDSAAPSPPAPALQAEAAVVLDETRIRRFVADYIAALNRADAQQLLSFYAERVDYFDFKGVGHDFILRDKQAFHKRWPVIDNRLAGDIAVDRSAGDGSASVSYAIRYQVSSPARGDAKTGTARDVLVLRLIQDRPLIVAQRQQALGDRAAN